MSNLEAVQHASRVYRARENMTREHLINEAIALGEWGVWSNRHIAQITGLRPQLVNELTGKTDKTGGRFDPEALSAIITCCNAKARADIDPALVKAALDAGISASLLEVGS